MNISRREGPFVADITGGLLTVRRDTSAEGWGMSGAHVYVPAASGPLFILPVADRPWPWFVLHGERVSRPAKLPLSERQPGYGEGTALCASRFPAGRRGAAKKEEQSDILIELLR